jgi:hypothetical protein
MASIIDKEIAKRAKKIDGDFEHLSKKCDNFWRIFFKRPIFVFPITVFLFVCFGFYQDWNWKNMIYVGYTHGITALITGLIQYFIFEKKNKCNSEVY